MIKEKVKNILIKVSGDLIKNQEALDFIKKLSKTNYVVVLCGGGRQITKAFERKNLKFKFGPAGRETDFSGRRLTREVLEQNQRQLRNKFVVERGINVNIEIPIIYLGGIMCPVNGDELIIAAYNGFDIIYIITTKERVAQKEEKFRKFPKIIVKGV